MTLINYPVVGDPGSATIINQAIRHIISLSGLDPDADFPGFLFAGAGGLGTGTNGLIALWDSGNKLKNGPANAVGFLSNDGAGVLTFKIVNLVTGAHNTFFIKGRDNGDSTDLDIIKVNTADEVEFGTLVNLGDLELKRALLSDTAEKIQSLGTVSGAQETDYSLGNNVKATLNGNTQFTATNWPASGRLGTIHYILDISGSITITWFGGTINWGNAGAPTPVSGERLHVTVMTDDAGTTIDGSWSDGH